MSKEVEKFKLMCVLAHGLDLSQRQVSYVNGKYVVDGNLYLYGTHIASLPDDLVVGGTIYKDF